MVEDINKLKRISKLIKEYYECLIDEELEIPKNTLRIELYKSRLKTTINEENKVLDNILKEYSIDKVRDYLTKEKESANELDELIIERLLNKINSITSKVLYKEELISTIGKETYFLSLTILEDIIKDHPELKDKLIVSIYKSYFTSKTIEIEEEIIANNFSINEHPAITTDTLAEFYRVPIGIHDDKKDVVLYIFFEKGIKVLNVLAKYTRDYDLIYIVISYIRALILQASDKEIFIMVINDILNLEKYKPIHKYLFEILKKMEEDRQIPIYINVEVQNGRY